MLNAALLVTASFVVGQHPQPSAYEHLTDLGCFIGAWESKATIPESSTSSQSLKKWAGKTTHLRMKVKWAAGKSAQIVEYVFEIPGEVRITETLLRGWDQSTKGVKDYSFTTHKGVWSGACNKVDDTWVMEYTGFNLDAKKCTGTREITFEGKDAFVAKDINQTVDGQPFPDMEYRFTRVTKKKPRLAETAVPKEAIQAMKYRVGKWESVGFTDGKKGEEPGLEVTEWAPGRHAIRISDSWVADGVRNQGAAVVGWDPEKKQLVEHWYVSDGGYATFCYDLDKEKDAWVGDFRWVQGDGAKFEGKSRVDKKSKDEWEWNASFVQDGENHTWRTINRRVK